MSKALIFNDNGQTKHYSSELTQTEINKKSGIKMQFRDRFGKGRRLKAIVYFFRAAVKFKSYLHGTA